MLRPLCLALALVLIPPAAAVRADVTGGDAKSIESAAKRVTAADVLDSVGDLPGLQIFKVTLDMSGEEVSDSFQTPRSDERIIRKLDDRMHLMQCVKGDEDGPGYKVEMAYFYKNRCIYYKIGREEPAGVFNARIRALTRQYGEPLKQRPEWVPAKQLVTDVDRPGDKVEYWYWVAPDKHEVLALTYNGTRSMSAHILSNVWAYERAFAEAKERLDDHNSYLQGKDRVHRE
jgi:hypothetical protein